MDQTEAAPDGWLGHQVRPEPDRESELEQESGFEQASGFDQNQEPGFDQDQNQEPVLDEEPGQNREPVLEQELVPEYPDPPHTGDAAVDQAIDAVARAVRGPLEEQLAAFDTAHRTLQGRLADVEG